MALRVISPTYYFVIGILSFLFTHSISAQQCLPTGSSVLINEVMINPTFSMAFPANTNSFMDNSPDFNGPNDDGEWIELYNPSACNAVDLSCYTIGFNAAIDSTAISPAPPSSARNYMAFQFPAGTTIPPLGYLVIGGGGVPAANIKLNNYLNSNNFCKFTRCYMGNQRGYIVLMDGSGAVADAIYWAPASTDLNTATEFDNSYINSCMCNTSAIPMAKAIPGIEYTLNSNTFIVPNQNQTLRRQPDGSANWLVGVPSIGACNSGTCYSLSIGTNVTPAACTSAGGSISATTTIIGAPRSNYTYSWSPTGGNNLAATGLTAGSYTITVTDVCGCTKTASAIVNTIVAPLNVNATTVAVSCNNKCDGAATAVPPGNANSFTYSWSPTGGNAISASGLCKGDYTVTVSDAAACSGTATMSVTEPDAILITPITNPSVCGQANGSAEVTVSGGNSSYTYLWTPGGKTDRQVTGLLPGIYKIVTTDLKNCKDSIDVTVNNDPGALTAAVSATIPVSCGGVCSGATAVNSQGGNGTISYLWTPGNRTTAAISNLCAATYTATVSDETGCTVSLTVSITEPPEIVLIANADPAACGQPTGQAIVVATGGTGNLSYSWKPGGGNNDTITDLYKGDYMVVVTDDNSCKDSLKVTVTEPPPSILAEFDVTPQPTTILNTTIYFTDASTNATCWQWNFGDVVSSSSTLQNPQFTYPDSAGSYDVTLIACDNDGCYDTIHHTIVVADEHTLFVPNSFTPNNDGVNDVFFPKGTRINPEGFELSIFDRWGELIYQTTSINRPWDGKANNGTEVVQVDTYVWRIVFKDATGQQKEKTGHVNVIR